MNSSVLITLRNARSYCIKNSLFDYALFDYAVEGTIEVTPCGKNAVEALIVLVRTDLGHHVYTEIKMFASVSSISCKCQSIINA